METKQELINALRMLNNVKTRSKWEEGIKYYANMLLDNFTEYIKYDSNVEFNEQTLLNGADDWKQYAYGGCGLVYDCAIAEILCTCSELNKKKGGILPPNKRETWIDVEARALYQAWFRLRRFYESLNDFRK